MKNMIELPTEADYHKTSLIDVAQSHQFQKKEDTISYKKCIINLRSIVDISEKSIMVTVIDEEKYPIYLEEMEKVKKRIPGRRVKVGVMQPGDELIAGEPAFQEGVPQEGLEIPLFGTPYPEVPIKQVKVTGVLILYFNGGQRFIVDDYQEFQEKYFDYLKFQKLDIGDMKKQ